MKCTNTESSLYSNKHLIDTSIPESQSHKPVSRPTATLQQSNVLITYAYREPRMHFCRVYLIFFGCVELCREQRRVGKRSARQARVSFGKNVLLPPPLRPSSSASEGSWSDFVARERAEEQDERRRRTWYKTGSAGEDAKERKRNKGEENWHATEAGNAEPNRAGYRCIGRWLSGIRARSTLEEFCLLLLFFLSPLRSRSLARPPLVA